MDATTALRTRQEGNERHAQGAQGHPRRDSELRAELVSSQRPWDAVLGCSDSRVPPEIVFDQGLGDLVVVRIAGHVSDEVLLSGLRSSVDRLGVRLVWSPGTAAPGQTAPRSRRSGSTAGIPPPRPFASRSEGRRSARSRPWAAPP